MPAPLCLLQVGCASQPRFGNQPVLKGARRSLHTPLGLGRRGKDHLDTQFSHSPAELGRPGREAGSRRVPEHAVAVGVESHGQAATLHQPADQQEVAVGILLLTEPGGHHRAGGVIHRQQQHELGASVLQPGVVATVQLHQHASLGHPLTTETVLRRAPAAGTADARLGQNAAHRGPAQVDAFPLLQQFGEMGVVGALVTLCSQLHHHVSLGGGMALWGRRPRLPWARAAAPSLR